MCGICGVYSTGGSGPLDEARVHSMLGMIQHRGPDANGLYLEDTIILGHTRLAIIDLDGGGQPMVSADGRYWIVFNGEVFNYLELKEQLKTRGYQFKNHSDTEVVVNAYAEWGDACFEKFNGQWALAIWDSVEKNLTLSRDPVGICPLYYHQSGERFYFASEIKSLFAVEEIPRQFSNTGLSQLFTLWGPMAPQTAFKDIFEVPPGHICKLSEGRGETRPYWQLGFDGAWNCQPKSFQQATEELKEKLETATRLRFTRSDVPVGAYLSGGLDSTVTTHLVKQFTDAPIETYSLRFADAEFDEGEFQQTVASELNTIHHQVNVSDSDIAQHFHQMLFHAERPVLRTAPVPMFLLSRLVNSSGGKVVVTGEGADEMLAGYDLFREAKVRRFIGRVPDSDKRKKLVARLYPWMHRNPGQVPAFARSFFSRDIDCADPGLSHRPRWNTSRSIFQFMTSPEADTEVAVFERLPEDWEKWHPLELAQWIEITTLLSGYLISAQGDRMLMGNSVEGRFPFLDIELIKFAATLNPLYKLWGLNEKHILKRAFADKIPAKVISRPKQPYRAPDASVFYDETGRQWLNDITRDGVLDEIDVIDADKVNKLILKGERSAGKKMGNTDNMSIVAMLSLASLHQQFIVGDSIRPVPVSISVRVDRREQHYQGRA